MTREQALQRAIECLERVAQPEIAALNVKRALAWTQVAALLPPAPKPPTEAEEFQQKVNDVLRKIFPSY